MRMERATGNKNTTGTGHLFVGLSIHRSHRSCFQRRMSFDRNGLLRAHHTRVYGGYSFNVSIIYLGNGREDMLLSCVFCRIDGEYYVE